MNRWKRRRRRNKRVIQKQYLSDWAGGMGDETIHPRVLSVRKVIEAEVKEKVEKR